MATAADASCAVPMQCPAPPPTELLSLKNPQPARLRMQLAHLVHSSYPQPQRLQQYDGCRDTTATASKHGDVGIQHKSSQGPESSCIAADAVTLNIDHCPKAGALPA